jgi:S1-C subfamily serine protease
VAAIRDRTPGDSISIDLVRDGVRLTVSAVLVARPQD